RGEIETAVREVLESQRFILGPVVEQLEREIATLCAVRQAVGVASGTDALMLALQAVGGEPGDARGTSSFSVFATASSLARLGAKPVFADIDATTFNLDPVDVGRAAAVPGVAAIMPVHLFGQCAPVEEIRRAAAVAIGADVALVEDAAQAIGATRIGRPAG